MILKNVYGAGILQEFSGDTTMSAHSARLANLLMMVAALALCVSACTGS